MKLATDIGGTFTDLVYLDEETGASGSGQGVLDPAGFRQGDHGRDREVRARSDGRRALRPRHDGRHQRADRAARARRRRW